jgi:hypothetical protein
VASEMVLLGGGSCMSQTLITHASQKHRALGFVSSGIIAVDILIIRYTVSDMDGRDSVALRLDFYSGNVYPMVGNTGAFTVTQNGVVVPHMTNW